MSERSLLIPIGATLGPLEKALATAAKRVESFGKSIVNLGEELKGAVTEPLVDAGRFAYEAATQIDDAMNAIRKSTGAQGSELDDLGQMFRDVFAEVPDAAGDVATAIGEVHKRLGLIGPDLEKTARDFLDFARINGEDVGPSCERTANLMNAWGVSARDIEPTLQKLNAVSQTSGISIAKLTEGLANNAATLKLQGIPLERAAAMMGLFEKSGLGADAMLAALKKAGLESAKGVERAGKAAEQAGRDIQTATAAIEAARARLDAARIRHESTLEASTDAWSKFLDEVRKPGLDQNTTQIERLASAVEEEKRAATGVTEALIALRMAKADGSTTTEQLSQAEARYEAAVNRAQAAEVRVKASGEGVNSTLDRSSSVTEKARLAYLEAQKTTLTFSDSQKALAKAHDDIAEQTAKLDDAIKRMTKAMNDSKSAALDLEKFFADIAAAPDMTAAMAIAVQHFGKNAAVLVDGIRRGGLAVDAYIQSWKKFMIPIREAAARVRTFGDQMKVLSHQVYLAVEPIGSALITALKLLVPYLQRGVKYVADLAKQFSALPAETQLNIIAWTAFAAALGPVLVVIGQVVAAGMSIGAAMAAVGSALGAVGSAIWAVFGALGGMITSAVVAIGGALASVGAPFAALGGMLAWIGETLLWLVGGPWGLALAAIALLATKWDWLKDKLSSVATSLGEFLAKAWRYIADGVRKAWTGMSEFIPFALGVAYDGAKKVLGKIAKMVAGVWNGIISSTKRIWEGLLDFLGGIWTGIKDGFAAAFRSVLSTIKAVWAAVGDIVDRLFGRGGAISEEDETLQLLTQIRDYTLGLAQMFELIANNLRVLAVWGGGGVPKMATGGVVTKPTTALIGEAGPEAVIPLDKLMEERDRAARMAAAGFAPGGISGVPAGRFNFADASRRARWSTPSAPAPVPAAQSNALAQSDKFQAANREWKRLGGNDRRFAIGANAPAPSTMTPATGMSPTGTASGRSVTVNVTVQGSVTTTNDLADTVYSRILEKQRQGRDPSGAVVI